MNAAASTVTSASPTATATAAPNAGAATWDVDPGHSSAGFKVRHLMVSNVRGSLGPVTGTVELDEQDVRRSRVQVSIDAQGIESKDEKRDAHLRSADFLDVSRYPAITFTSTEVRAVAGGDLEVDGELTIRGVTRTVTLAVEALPPEVKDPWGKTRRGAMASASINRKDFGLEWNLALEAGGVVVGERVAIELEVELVKR